MALLVKRESKWRKNIHEYLNYTFTEEVLQPNKKKRFLVVQQQKKGILHFMILQ